MQGFAISRNTLQNGGFLLRFGFGLRGVAIAYGGLLRQILRRLCAAGYGTLEIGVADLQIVFHRHWRGISHPCNNGV